VLDRGGRRFGRDPYERGARRVLLTLAVFSALALTLVGLRVGFVAARAAGLAAWPVSAGCGAACLLIGIVAGWIMLRE
jgi:hypothetical protein